MKLANITSRYRASLIAEVYQQWVRSRDSVLDVGCGTGVVAEYISKKLDLKITGCDIDKYLIKKISFVKMNSLSDIPKNKSYDAAMFNDMLHHTELQNQIVLIEKALAISGYVLIFELIPNNIGKIGDFVLNKIHNPRMDIPFTYRTPSQWESLFKKNRIKFDKIIVRRPLLYPFRHVAYKLNSK